ncbi:MAG: DNRLRE domain-containing protein [Desulfatitalea sp.]|nr:DNRLRE domain-containing protein [Desulfatitalea sp.]
MFISENGQSLPTYYYAVYGVAYDGFFSALRTASATQSDSMQFIELQQGINSYTGFDDTVLSSYSLTEKRTNYGGDDYIRIWSDGVRRVFLKAALPDLPADSLIDRATLRLYCYSERWPSATRMLYAYRVKNPWVEGSSQSNGATWYEFDYLDDQLSQENDWETQGGDIDRSTDFGFGANGIIAKKMFSQGGWVEFDITALANLWLDGSMPNHGIMIESLEKGNSVYFYSSEYNDAAYRPKLSITYHSQPQDTPESDFFIRLQQDVDDYDGFSDTILSSYSLKEKENNFGGEKYLRVWSKGVRKVLISADLSILPADITIQQANLRLYCYQWSWPSTSGILQANPVIQPWIEGSGTFNVGSFDGATWFEYDYVDGQASGAGDWQSPGGDIDMQWDFGYGANGVVSEAFLSENAWVDFNITQIVKDWHAGVMPNYGLLISGIRKGEDHAMFFSIDSDEIEFRPIIEMIYTKN